MLRPLAVPLALVHLLLASATSAGDAPRSEPAPVAFVRVHVVPMDSERVLRDQTVLVVGGRIARVGPVDEVEVPGDAEQIDGRGELFLMPGLCDSHIHVLDPDEFVMYLANGVTTVRNMSGEPFHLAWRRELAEGRRLGPTLLTTGPTMDSVPPDGSNRVIVTTRAEGERAVEAIAAQGYDLLKVYGGLSAEAFGGIVDAAGRTGLKVAGHVPRSVGLDGALAAGQDSIDHAEEYLYTFFRDAGVEKLPEAVSLTRAAGAFVTPTLVTFERIGAQIADASALASCPELRFADPAARESWLSERNRYLRDFSPDDAPRFRDQLRFLQELVRQLHAAGVPLLAGTDAGVAFGVPFVLPGWSLHEELAQLVGCGLSPYEALRSATANPARFLGREREFGLVAEGARADLLLLEANPLDDVANAARRVGVMARGRWLTEAELTARLDGLEALYRDEAAFVALLRAEGVAAAVERFRAARLAAADARLFREDALNGLGYELLDERPADAVTVFQLNVEAYPDSANAHDSLGEGYMRAGKTDLAIESYERSLAMDPGNTNAAAMLEELRRD